jgi:imidazolonepropionase-like amidohydrolase
MGERDDIPEAVPHGYVELAVRQKALEHLLRFLRMFHDAGGKLLIGTDAAADADVVPGRSLHTELELFAAAGLDPLTIIRIASQQAAEAMRRANDQGSLTPGKRADAVLLTADPIADIRNTRKIELVIKDGVRYRPEELSQREDR